MTIPKIPIQIPQKRFSLVSLGSTCAEFHGIPVFTIVHWRPPLCKAMMTMIFINLFRCRNYSNASDSLVQCLLALVMVGNLEVKLLG